MKRIQSLCLAAGSLLVMLSAGSSVTAQQQTNDSVVVERDVMVKMRDGTKLATDIYRPARNGKAVEGRFPVILQRTPYDKSKSERTGRYFAAHGYVVALQDIRGRHHSEGVFFKYDDHDAPDGYDTVQWLASLPYSNGEVGMSGTSYVAHTQSDAAKLHPPALKALVLNMGGMANAWNHSVRFNGAFELGRQLSWAWQQAIADARSPVVKQALESEKLVEWYEVQPMRKGLNPLSVVPNYEDYYLEEATHANEDGYWDRLGMNWEKYYAQTSDIPMMHVSGWYDIYTRGSFENFIELRKLKKAPQRLTVGPWTHGGNMRTYAGDVSFGPAGAIADFSTAWHLRWFDHFLKGEKNGVEKEAPIRLFVMGTGDGHKDADGRLFHGGYWRDAQEWPLSGTKFVNYYFHADGSLGTAKPSASEAPSTTYTFDPADPVPTIGGGVSSRLKDGGFNQREDPRFPPSKPPYLPLSARADVVVFQTEPLEQDVEVIGPIKVVLYASTDRTDTDFTAKLVDVYPSSSDWPNGFDLNITDAIVRGRYRTTTDHEVLLHPGQVYEFTIDPYPTANVFKKGHRIRVDISSSNYPRFDVNPNTGEPLGKSRRMVKADNTIYHGTEHASYIVLPIAPPRR
jgi:putative CocE/NonD family hydrolase